MRATTARKHAMHGMACHTTLISRMASNVEKSTETQLNVPTTKHPHTQISEGHHTSRFKMEQYFVRRSKPCATVGLKFARSLSKAQTIANMLSGCTGPRAFC